MDARACIGVPLAFTEQAAGSSVAASHPPWEQWYSRAKVVAQTDWNLDLLRQPLSEVVASRADGSNALADRSTSLQSQIQAPSASGAHPVAWEPATSAAPGMAGHSAAPVHLHATSAQQPASSVDPSPTSVHPTPTSASPRAEASVAVSSLSRGPSALSTPSTGPGGKLPLPPTKLPQPADRGQRSMDPSRRPADLSQRLAELARAAKKRGPPPGAPHHSLAPHGLRTGPWQGHLERLPIPRDKSLESAQSTRAPEQNSDLLPLLAHILAAPGDLDPGPIHTPGAEWASQLTALLTQLLQPGTGPIASGKPAERYPARTKGDSTPGRLQVSSTVPGLPLVGPPLGGGAGRSSLPCASSTFEESEQASGSGGSASGSGLGSGSGSGSGAVIARTTDASGTTGATGATDATDPMRGPEATVSTGAAGGTGWPEEGSEIQRVLRRPHGAQKSLPFATTTWRDEFELDAQEPLPLIATSPLPSAATNSSYEFELDAGWERFLEPTPVHRRYTGGIPAHTLPLRSTLQAGARATQRLDAGRGGGANGVTVSPNGGGCVTVGSGQSPPYAHSGGVSSGGGWVPSGVDIGMVEGEGNGNGEDGGRERGGEERAAEVLRVMLLELTEAVATCNQVDALRLALAVRRECHPLGTPMQRIAYYLSHALSKRMGGSGAKDYMDSVRTNTEAMQAMLEFSAGTPFIRFHYTALAHSVLDAAQDQPHLHFLDFGHWGGFWPLVIRQLRPLPFGRRRRIKLTAVLSPPDYPQAAGPSVTASALRSEFTSACVAAGIQFEFQVVVCSPESLDISMLPAVDPSDAVVVTLATRLSSLLDSSVLLTSSKDRLLQALLQFNPIAVLAVDFDCDQQQPVFLRRVRSALDYFLNIFMALDSLAPRESLARRGVEELVMARELINLVACEGLQRMARSESLEELSARMRRTGFRTREASAGTRAALERILDGQPGGFLVRQLSQGSFQLTWQGRPTCAASFWQPSLGRSVTLVDTGDFSL